MVIVLPVLILLVMVVMQSALFFHTAHVARAAAAEGAVAAASHLVPASATERIGAERATAFVVEAGGRIARDPSSDVRDGLIRVSVTLEVPSLVPFWSSSVTREAVEPKERLLTELER